MDLCFHQSLAGLLHPEPRTCYTEAPGMVGWARGASPATSGVDLFPFTPFTWSTTLDKAGVGYRTLLVLVSSWWHFMFQGCHSLNPPVYFLLWLPNTSQPFYFLLQLYQQAEQVIHLFTPHAAVISPAIPYQWDALAFPAAWGLDGCMFSWQLSLGCCLFHGKSRGLTFTFTLGGCKGNNH